MTSYDDNTEMPAKSFIIETPFNPAVLRGALSKRFLKALADDFARHGTGALRRLRRERGRDYLKLIAMLLPKEYRFREIELAEMSDEEIAELHRMLRKLTEQQEKKED